jgi:hypothetical protein
MARNLELDPNRLGGSGLLIYFRLSVFYMNLAFIFAEQLNNHDNGI